MYVIVGARGFLGGYLIRNICQSSSEFVIGTYHSDELHLPLTDKVIWKQLDVTDIVSVRNFARLLYKFKEDTNEQIKCIYVAGYIKPDDCLNYPERAIDVNVRSLLDFVSECRAYIDSLIFTSTDFVFNESINGYKYKEQDSPSPINLYGHIKLSCEKIIKLTGYNVVRLPFMFGKSLNLSRPHFIEHIEEICKTKTSFKMLADYYENSLDYNSVSKLILALYDRFDINLPADTIHICSDQPVSKFEIAKRYAEARGLDCSTITPLKLSEANFFKARRATILMDNALIKKLLKVEKIDFSVD